MNTQEATTITPAQEPRLLTFAQVSERVGLKRTAIYAAIKEKTFPAPKKIRRSSRWLESEITEWIDGLTQLAA